MTEYPDTKRVSDIIKSLEFCDEAVTPESIRKQFFSETHREPPGQKPERDLNRGGRR